MIAFPVTAAAISLVFGVHLLARFAAAPGRRPHEAAWSAAMLLYAGASAALALGVLGPFSPIEFRLYWLLGAVLSVPYLALGEAYLLVRDRRIAHAVAAVVVVASAWAAWVVLAAAVDPAALAHRFPLGREVFGDGTLSHRLAQLYSYPAYVYLVAGALVSARRMRGRPELRNRFQGTLLIAVGATLAAVGSGIGAGFGNFAVFSAGIASGAAVLYWCFLTATRPA